MQSITNVNSSNVIHQIVLSRYAVHIYKASMYVPYSRRVW